MLHKCTCAVLRGRGLMGDDGCMGRFSRIHHWDLGCVACDVLSFSHPLPLRPRPRYYNFIQTQYTLINNQHPQLRPLIHTRMESIKPLQHRRAHSSFTPTLRESLARHIKGKRLRSARPRVSSRLAMDSNKDPPSQIMLSHGAATSAPWRFCGAGREG